LVYYAIGTVNPPANTTQEEQLPQGGFFLTPEQDSNGFDNLLAGKLVLGEPLKVGGTTLVPVISVTAGYGKFSDTNGGGGGFLLNPVAIVAIHGESTQVYSLQRQGTVEELSSVLDELIDTDLREVPKL